MSPRTASRLYLVDGYALIYRSFFAMIHRPLRTSRGENTSAVWGVANFIHRLLERHRPEYLAWVHDAGTSFRTETYPEYKAPREKLDDQMQEDFDRSVERTEELLEALQIPLIEVDGYEADDVIGTLAERAKTEGLQTVIVSGDKDFYQLISGDVLVLNPGRGGPSPVDELMVGPDNATERLGVPPERVVDYLALVGDSSDNVPGIKGIGDKTARALIEEFGGLDEILSNAERVKAKRAREGLLNFSDDALLSRDLVTIQRDVPVELNLDRLRIGTSDSARLRALYTELEFGSLVSRLAVEQVSTAPESSHEIVRTVSGLSDLMAAARKADVAALEAVPPSQEHARRPAVGLAISLSDGRSWYLPLEHYLPDGLLISASDPGNLPSLSDPGMAVLVEWLQDDQAPKVGHDLKRTWLSLRASGVELEGVELDTMLVSFLLDPGRRSHDLEGLARENLNEEVRSYESVAGKGKSERPFTEVEIEDAASYCCSRSRASLRLRESFRSPLDKASLNTLLNTIEMPLIGVLVDMEWRGICIDSARLGDLSLEFTRELREIERSIFEEAATDFNINSTPQLRHVLFEKLGLPVLKRTKTGASTDAGVLSQLAEMGFEVPRLLLEYRELSKLKSTYVDVLPKSVDRLTQRVHTSFNQAGAATGRLSSSDPNLQNIPVRTARGELIRGCFVPAPGCCFIVADYSQIELRVLAHLSEDAAFIDAFNRGGDIHRETAAIIFDVAVEGVTAEMRARAKTINFATIYGQGAFSLARQLGISQEEAKEFIRLYFERFAGVRTFLDATIERARKDGYVETMFGRRRYIPELRDPNYNVRAFGERTAMNSPMQGSAADLIKIAMTNLSAALTAAGMNAAMLLQVHDELVLESPEREVEAVADLVRLKMEGAAELRVPLVVDIGVGSDWLDAKA
jgi:DNA polymerase-1